MRTIFSPSTNLQPVHKRKKDGLNGPERLVDATDSEAGLQPASRHPVAARYCPERGEKRTLQQAHLLERSSMNPAEDPAAMPVRHRGRRAKVSLCQLVAG
jgi:hypothetical protein